MRALRVAFSPCFFHADTARAVFKGKTLQYLEQSIAQWVMAAGALAYMVPQPPAKSVTTRALLEDFDGLILQGGSDVAPETYGEVALRPEWKGDRVRDLFELELLKEAMAVGMPVLGICRGLQLLNVARGGTLYQDITLQKPGSLVHRNWDIYDQNFHQIKFVPGGHLAALYGDSPVAKVNSVHHQGIKDLGDGLISEAICVNDEIIEAVRLKGSSYVLAVQWHPEFQSPDDATLLDRRPLLQDFLNASNQYRANRKLKGEQ
jgi:putative glutamine amidotransferase